MSIFVFYGYENGGIGKKIMLLPCSGAEIHLLPLQSYYHILHVDGSQANVTFISHLNMLAIFCLFLYPHFHTRRTRIWTHKHTPMFTLGCRWIWGIFKYFTGDFTSNHGNGVLDRKMLE